MAMVQTHTTTTTTPRIINRPRRCCSVDVTLFAGLSLGIFCVFFGTIHVEGFVQLQQIQVKQQQRQDKKTDSLWPLASTEVDEDIDVVGEGRRGDAMGAALRLVDVAVSRGGKTLLSNIDLRVEPKSKWAIVVS